MFIKKLLSNFWKSLLVVLVILYLSFAPASTFKSIPVFEHEDKVVHMLMYFGLTFVFIFDFKRSRWNNRNILFFVFICLLLPVLLGGFIEILQGNFFAPRTGSWTDWLADIAGVFLGWASISLFNIRKGN